jgi:DNA-binding transcriptional MerR regulator/methylmalonyl-CoA mutase cobalamin-binding subunit
LFCNVLDDTLSNDFARLKYIFDYVDFVSTIFSVEPVQYSIRVAARRTGLTPHVIRVWERRYGAVEPTRTETNRRVYSGAQIERLTLLRHAITAGHRIGNIAKLDAEQLKQLVGEVVLEQTGRRSSAKGTLQADAGALAGECLDAVRRMDAAQLEDALSRALVVLGHQGLLQKVVAPFARDLGELWQEGSLSAAHEHFASAALRVFLGNAARPFAAAESAPCLVVATPAGQLHELGAVMISTAAGNLGWRVAYLGVSLPAAEIAGAAQQKQARAVALSVVYPSDDSGLPAELTQLRRLVGAQMPIIVGGRAASAYRDALTGIGAVLLEDFDAFGKLLDSLRVRPAGPPFNGAARP